MAYEFASTLQIQLCNNFLMAQCLQSALCHQMQKMADDAQDKQILEMQQVQPDKATPNVHDQDIAFLQAVLQKAQDQIELQSMFT
jgi:hypothetical protein